MGVLRAGPSSALPSPAALWCGSLLWEGGEEGFRGWEVRVRSGQIAERCVVAGKEKGA